MLLCTFAGAVVINTRPFDYSKEMPGRHHDHLILTLSTATVIICLIHGLAELTIGAIWKLIRT